MALAGELAKYIGGELVKNTGKELATNAATSALSNLAPKIATKAVASMANKSVLNSLVPTATRKLASGIELGTDMIPMFRGQTNTLDKLDYNKGLSPNSNGFFMTPNKSATDSWAGKGVVSVDADPNDIMTLDELRSLKKSAEKYFRDPKYQMELYNTNPTQAEIYDALEAGDSYQELSRLTKKPFIERDGGQGTELGEVVFFPDTNPELTSRYNADLASGKNQWLAPTEDVVASETSVPAGTKIKFDKDLNIKDIEKPSRGRGWYADNETNPHISQVVKQNGLDKYLGEPKVSQSLVELSPIVADENGVAKTFYHGSPSMDITDFDINMAGKNTRSGERAIWFTDDYPTAEEFSYERIPGDTLFADKRGAKGKVYERNLGLENPLDLSNLSDKQIEELYNYADSRMAFDGKENFIRRMKEFRDAGNDQLIKSQLDMKKLSNSEYDGIVAKMYPGENEVREIGVFDAGKIKKPVKHIPIKQNNYSPLYHQTSAKSLADFSLDKRKSIGSDYGMPEGIFLKDTNADIGLPGKNQLKLDAKMNNPITFENRQELAKYMEKRNPEYKALVKKLDEINETYDEYLINYMAERGMNPDEYFDFDTAMNEVDKYIEDKAREAREMISAQLKKDGYDSVIVNKDEGTRGRTVKSYIVLDKEQLRDNAIPVKIKKYLDNIK